jgi:hypothetical protein
MRITGVFENMHLGDFHMLDSLLRVYENHPTGSDFIPDRLTYSKR